MRDLRWAITGLVVGTTLLSGCSEKVEANDTLPSTSASPTTEALPPVGPADFPVPAEARTKDAAGAEAFLRYWIDLLNQQQAIPAGQPLRDLGPECADCLRIAARYDEVADAGQRIEGGQLSITTEPTVLPSDKGVEFAFMARVEAVNTYDASGTPVAGLQYPAEDNLSSGVGLTWSAELQSWLVTGVTIG